MNAKIAKMKARIKNDVIKVKFVIFNPMSTKIEAQRKGMKQDYITHILVTVDGRTLFEFKPTSSISKNPLFYFKCKAKEIKVGDTIVLSWTTLLGESKHFSKKIR